MGALSYYLATSLDGYLARPDGRVDWLEPFQEKLNTPYDFEVFYQSVSTILTGRKSWEVAKSFEANPFSAKKVHIVSRTLQPRDIPSYGSLLNQLDRATLDRLKSESAGRLWLLGGADMAGQLLQMGLIDEIIQTVIPVTLGSGILWMGAHQRDTRWDLVDCVKVPSGIVQLIYRKPGVTA